MKKNNDMATIDDNEKVTATTQPQEDVQQVENTADTANETATAEPQQQPETENNTEEEDKPAEPQKIPKQDTPYDNSSTEQFYATYGTPPQRELTDKEKKKAKRENIFSAIGDGLAALSNVYFTTKGAPSMYTAKNSLTDAAQKRYDKMVAARGKDAKQYYLDLNNALAKDRKWFSQAREDDRKDLDSGANATLKLSQAGLNDKKGGTEEARQGLIEEQTKGQSIDNEYKPKEKEAAIKKTNSETSRNYSERDKAQAQAQQAQAQAQQIGNGTKIPSLTIKGSIRNYDTKDDWEKDVYKNATELGIDLTKMYDEGITEKEKDKAITDIASKVERASEIVWQAKQCDIKLDTSDKDWEDMSNKEKQDRLKEIEKEIKKSRDSVNRKYE